MEFAFDTRIPNYAGGLGVLAADMMYSAADMGLPIVGVSLIYHQEDDPKKAFDPGPFMKKHEERIRVIIENREVQISIWEMEIKGRHGHVVPVYFLSTFLPENPEWDRDITKYLYSSNGYTRLCQEAILGLGGVRALNAMGHADVDVYHMNEGHSAFLTLELLRKSHYREDAVKNQCTFTTHTPIPAGHDYFGYDLVYKTINKIIPLNIKELATQERLGMTQLALNLSKKANSVSAKHREVCQNMFPEHTFENVTNGVYHSRWVGDHMRKLYDTHIPGWEDDISLFKNANTNIPAGELRDAHNQEKSKLIQWINSHAEFFPFDSLYPEDHFDVDTLTIGFARRFVPYKRPDLIFHHLNELREIGFKKLQLIFSGHCHPDDPFCNNMKHVMGNYGKVLRNQVRVAVLPDYNIDISKRLVTGCDIWLNNPVPPEEASGTSGMKAALNGNLNLSILDGWWLEGFEMDSKAGWGFGQYSTGHHLSDRDENDAKELMQHLYDAVDCYYLRKKEWGLRMKHAISLLGYFSTHRSLQEYYERLWDV